MNIARGKRPGYTLVELLVVISVNSVLMGAAAVLLATLLRTDRQGQRHFERTGALMRLTEQLHTDIAAARQASTVAGAANEPADPATGPSQKLRLQGPAGQAIEYWRDGDGVRRAEYRDRAIVRREAYTLADLADAEFMLPDASLAVVRLTLRDASGARAVLNIETRVAKDWRFARESQP